MFAFTRGLIIMIIMIIIIINYTKSDLALMFAFTRGLRPSGFTKVGLSLP